MDRPTLTPSEIGKLINLNSCNRYFKLRIHDDGFDEFNHDTNSYIEAFHIGNIVERKTGEDFEEKIRDELSNTTDDLIDLTQTQLGDVIDSLSERVDYTPTLDEMETELESSRNEILDKTLYDLKEKFGDGKHTQIESELFNLREKYTSHKIEESITRIIETRNPPKTEPIILYQPTLTGKIGAWYVAGDADLLFIWPGDTSDIRMRIVDIKVAEEERSHHQIQTATYAQLLTQQNPREGLTIDVQGGVLTSSYGSILPPTPEKIPQFDIEDRITDINQLLKPDGKFDKLHQIKRFEDAPYQLDQHCSQCKYNEACYADSVENKRIELLGIDNGTRQRLGEHGIDTLDDLASLAPAIDDSVLTPEERPDPGPSHKNRQTYNQLASLPGIGEKLPYLVQRAQSLLGSINPSSMHAHGNRDAPHLTDIGHGEIPSDSHPGNKDYKEGSMIRVYLNIQHDHLRDRIIGIGATVTATASSTDSQSFASIADSVSTEENEMDIEEYNLLADFTPHLFDSIKEIGNGIDLSDEPFQSDPFLHFFTFTDSEHEILQQTLAKYTLNPNARPPNSKNETHEKLHALKDLLGKREQADQSMLSAVQPDIKNRMALKSPTAGLVNIYGQFYPQYRPEERKPQSDWNYTPTDTSRLKDGQTEVDIREVFHYRLFNNHILYEENGGDINFLLDDDDNRTKNDGRYPARVRTGAQIPLAYLWSAIGRIDDKWVEEAKEAHPRTVIDPFRYHDSRHKETRIIPEDATQLIQHLTQALRHVEQGIPKRNYITNPQAQQHD